jgi:hypothetical protein
VRAKSGSRAACLDRRGARAPVSRLQQRCKRRPGFPGSRSLGVGHARTSRIPADRMTAMSLRAAVCSTLTYARARASATREVAASSPPASVSRSCARFNSRWGSASSLNPIRRELWIYGGIPECRLGGHQQRAIYLQCGVIAAIVQRDSGETRLVPGATRRNRHVCAVMLHGLKAADRPRRLFSQPCVRNAHRHRRSAMPHRTAASSSLSCRSPASSKTRHGLAAQWNFIQTVQPEALFDWLRRRGIVVQRSLGLRRERARQRRAVHRRALSGRRDDRRR